MAMFVEKKDKENQLCWLQVDPDNCVHNKDDRKYSGVGGSIVGFLKDKHNQKPMFVLSFEIALDFYQNRGFKEDLDNNDGHENKLVWEG